jgi:hypothetical protein
MGEREKGMKRLVASVVLMMLLCVAIAGAQQTDSQILGIELGFAGGYRLADNELVGGQTFGLNLTVAPSFQAGLHTASVSGAGVTNNYGLFGLSYFLTQSLGMNVLVGATTAGDVAGGVGMFFNLFKSQNEGSFSSALKIKLQYLFNVADGIAGGSILLGVSSAFGL